MKSFTLTATDIPTKKAGRYSVYMPVVNEFYSGDSSSALVEMTGKAQPAAVKAGLVKAVASLGLSDKIVVAQRGNAVYLGRK